MNKTYVTRASEIDRQWHEIDAAGQVLGRLSTRIAGLLMGKHKPSFCRNLDMGDFVVVTNAEKVRVTGNKLKQKTYYRHSGYPGGIKSLSLEQMLETHPTRVIEYAVRGMLPQNKLRAGMLKRLRIYTGEGHPHQAQVASSRTPGGSVIRA